MKKAILILISSALWVSVGAFASQGPAAGKSVLKLDDDLARGAGKTLSAINKEIAQVDQEIVDSRNLAATYKALPNNGLRSSQTDAQTTALEIQRDELLRQRDAIVKSAE